MITVPDSFFIVFLIALICNHPRSSLADYLQHISFITHLSHDLTAKEIPAPCICDSLTFLNMFVYQGKSFEQNMFKNCIAISFFGDKILSAIKLNATLATSWKVVEKLLCNTDLDTYFFSLGFHEVFKTNARIF